MAQIKVDIGGRSYRMACADGEEAHLQGLAGEVDRQIEALRASIGEVGDTRLAVMAAIVFADERNEAQRKLNLAETGAKTGVDATETAARHIEDTERKAKEALDAAAERIEALTRQMQHAGPT